MYLAWLEESSILCWRCAGRELEGTTKVALVGESRTRGDVGERALRGAKLMRGVLDPELANVFSDTTTAESSEHSRQVHDVDARYVGGFGNC